MSAEVPRPGPEHEKLAAFVGTWNTRGEIHASAAGPATTFHARDTYEWLPGHFFIVHRWSAQMPDGAFEGIEIIGFDPEAAAYPMHSFDSRGNATRMEAHLHGDTWTFTGDTMRFSGAFRDSGATFAGVWEQRATPTAPWIAWMQVELKRTGKHPG